MRFALIATTAAAVVAVPFALAATGPQMSSGEFLAAVRCAAYADAAGAQVQEARYELNAESLRQAPATVVEAKAIARQAVNSQTATDQASVRSERASACSNASLAASVGEENAV